jgi:hypothetical protein
MLFHCIQEVEVSITLNAAWIVDTTGEKIFFIGTIELSHSKKPSRQLLTGLFPATVMLDADDGREGNTISGRL